MDDLQKNLLQRVYIICKYFDMQREDSNLMIR